jgi:NADPH2:quinone reductase
MRAIRVEKHGGPDVLAVRTIERPSPGPGEALVRVRVAGVNFVDVYHRTGLYPRTPPFTPGVEGVGLVEELGADVTEVAPGDRVAWAMVPGSYAEYAVIPATRLVPVPDGVSDDVAAAAMVQGLTAQYLSHSTYPIQHGDSVLIHAAAGGVGLLLTQMARRLGAHVIATVSTEEKARLAREAGANDVILYTQADFVHETRRLTRGAGVAAAYDSVGRTTFDGSLDALHRRGYLVLFGQSSGTVPPFDLSRLARGSLFVTRPSLADYIADRAELLTRASDVFTMILHGELRVHVGDRYPLAEAAQAHRDLEGRKTTGKVVLEVNGGA